MTKNIRFFVGGPDFHPVEEQARCIVAWLGPDYQCEFRQGAAAFEDLEACDLLVLMGLFWTGMDDYQPLPESGRAAFESYVASGRPLLAHHGAIASYDDWPRFGELVGFAWIWGTTEHSPIETHRVRVLDTGHPIIRDVTDYTLHDELYYDLQIAAGLEPQVHAVAQWQGQELPMVFTAEGARVNGAGRVVYLANGHDMKAFDCPALRQLWLNAVRWLLASQP